MMVFDVVWLYVVDDDDDDWMQLILCA